MRAEVLSLCRWRGCLRTGGDGRDRWLLAALGDDGGLVAVGGLRGSFAGVVVLASGKTQPWHVPLMD